MVPSDAEALEPHLSHDLETITFGPGGDVFAAETTRGEGSTTARIVAPSGEASFELPFTEAHNIANAVCAVAIGVALAAPLDQMAIRTPGISFSRLRGELIDLPAGSLLVNDCYNANPVSMRAALDNLASLEVSGRRIAVLGGMAELGPEAPSYHREAGAHARDLGIDVVVGVGELARDYAPDEWVPEPALRGGAGREAPRRGRRDPGEGLALGRARGLRRTVGGRLMPLAQLTNLASEAIDRGEVLIAGMAAMLITIFLGPKFIEYLRVKEFGQQIREDGPEGHHEKAGTPTMGGLILFLAIAIPYLVLSDATHRASPSSGSRSPAPRSASPTTSSRSRSGARSASRPATSSSVRSRSRSPSGGSPTTSSASTRRSSRGSSTARSRSGRSCTSSSSTSSSPERRTRSTSPTASTVSPPDRARSSSLPIRRSRSPPVRRAWR